MRILPILSIKSLAVAGVAAAALGTGAVVASAATTEDEFGHQVRGQVAACKASAARTHTHGIGECVSDWVVAHNPGHTKSSPSPEPSESPKPEPSETPDADRDDAGRTAPPHVVKPAAAAGHGHSTSSR